MATSRSAAQRAVWRAAASPGGLIGLLALFACLATAGTLIARLLQGQDTSGVQAVLAVFAVVIAALAAMLAYLLYGYFTLAYVLDRQTLTIRWGFSHAIIPLSRIEYVGPATQLLEGQRPGATVPWPGYYLETYPSPDGIGVRTFATQPLHRQVMVCTADAFYALSPERPIRFMEELVRLRERVASAPATGERRRLVEPVPQATQPLPVPARAARAEVTTPTGTSPAQTTGPKMPNAGRLSAPPSILRDRLAQVQLGLAGALVVGMLVFIIWKLPSLPDRIPLHFNALGTVDRIGQPGEILWLPALAGAVFLSNLLLALSVQRYDPFAARLLLAGPIVTAMVAWVAVVNLI